MYIMLYTCTEVSRGGEWGRRRRLCGRVVGVVYLDGCTVKPLYVCVMNHASCIKKYVKDVWMYGCMCERCPQPQSCIIMCVAMYVLYLQSTTPFVIHLHPHAASNPARAGRSLELLARHQHAGTEPNTPFPPQVVLKGLRHSKASQGLTSSTTQVFRADLSRNIMYCVTQYVHVHIYMYIVIHNICNST